MKTRRNQRKPRKARAGTATVDFALTFPLVLGIFMAMIFFVQTFLYKNTASNAAYEAARKGIVLGTTDADVQAAAESVMSTVAIREKEIIIDRTDDTITVSISIPMRGNSWATGTLFPSDISVGASCTLNFQMD